MGEIQSTGVTHVRKCTHIIKLFILWLGDWQETILNLTCVVIDNIMRTRSDFILLTYLLFGIYYVVSAYLLTPSWVIEWLTYDWIKSSVLWQIPNRGDTNFTKCEYSQLIKKLSQGLVWTEWPTSIVVKWLPDVICYCISNYWIVCIVSLQTEPMALSMISQMLRQSLASKSEGVVLLKSEYGTFCLRWRSRLEPPTSVKDPKKSGRIILTSCQVGAQYLMRNIFILFLQ